MSLSPAIQRSEGLHEASGFNRLVNYYEQNKHRPWNEWLRVEEIFPRPGKQGLVGVMTATDDVSIKYVFKISQYINYLAQHEFAVGEKLVALADYCPHYCRVIGVIVCPIDPTKRREGNPLQIDGKYSIDREILLMEYISGSNKLYTHIKHHRTEEAVLFSAVKQVLLSLEIAQKNCRFTHYDLHSNNIMMRRCDPNMVMLYVLDEDNQFCVPTLGYCPVIIDYGFAYSSGLDGGPLWPTLNHTEVGFLSDRFDPISDSKLFLVTFAAETAQCRQGKAFRKIRNITRNAFSRLAIDWMSGWDTETKICASDYLLELLNRPTQCSKLFREYEYHCFDLLQTLVILPLEKQDYSDIEIPFVAFLREFIKIEKVISSPFFGLYILKTIVDAAREVQADYRKVATRQQAVGYFRQTILEHIDSVAKYCQIKDLHYERMLCSLLCLAKQIEGVLYVAMSSIQRKKVRRYNRLPLKTPAEYYSVIEANIRSDYELTARTTVMIVNDITKSCQMVQLTRQEAKTINQYDSISRGMELYRLLQRRPLSAITR